MRSRLFCDHRVRRVEDRVGRAVVLLERDHAGLGEVALELEDVPDVGASECVDRLVWISDHHQVPVLAGEQLEQPVLRVVRVLILVDQHVPERLLPALQRLGEPLQHLDGEHQQVVEVHRVRVVQPLLVQPVHVGHGLVVERLDAAQVLVRADQLVLRVRDLRVDPARDEPLRIAVEILQALLGQPHLVGLVVDREVRLVAEPRRLAAEDPAARGVEGEDPDRPGDVAEQALEPVAHLPGRLVRERDREDLVRVHAAGRDQVRDPVGEDAGLPRAGAGDHEQRPLGRQHRLPLGRVQVGEVVLRLRDGHASDASGARQRSSRTWPDGASPRGFARIDALARYVIRGGRQGYDRLQVLHRSRWPDTARLFERVGVAPGMRCIDLGCGGGRSPSSWRASSVRPDT